MYKYTLAVTSPEYWNTIHNALIVDSNEDGIPDRKVICSDVKEHSPTRGTYWLTEDEATGISTHPNVKWIELSISDYPNVYPKPEPDTKRFKKDVKVYRDLGSNAPPTNPTSAEENRTNWATKRVGITTNGDSWPNVTGNPGVINTDLSFSLTGKNVDLIIQDSGCLQYHPEFIDDDGKSRVRDIVLDGPYYIDPDYFNAPGASPPRLYTKTDGRTGITTTAAHAWWESVGSRSVPFQSLATFSIPNNYTEANALGIGGTSHTMTSSHGTACASLSGGKNFGLAFESNLWTISIFSPADISTDISYDLMKIFHQNKPINTATGRKNPTVVNGSWGYFGGFNSGTTVNYSFKGSTGSFTGYSSSSTGVQALAYGLKAGQYYNRQYATSSGNNSVDTAGDEMVEAGVIFVTSAGNSNQRLGIGNNDPHINDYLTSLNGGDSRTGFPSASQSGTKPVGHVKWIHPARNGYDSVNDIYSSIIVGAMDDYINSDYTERKASYSNNGPGIDLYAPADETLAAGMRAANGDQLGTETNYARYNSDFVDRYFNGTSAASPVVAGLVALFLQSKPDATSGEVKDYLKTFASQVIPESWEDTTTDDTDANYWRGDYNNRGAASRVLFDPTASDTRSAFAISDGSQNIITTNNVLLLDANSYSGSGKWLDTSGSDNHGTITSNAGGSLTYVSDGNASYFNFANDGSSNTSRFVMDSGMFNPNVDHTFSIWVRMNFDSGNAYQAFLAEDDSSGGILYRYVNNSGGHNGLQLVRSYQSNKGSFSNSTSLTNNTIYNFTFTRSGNTFTAYINGVQKNPNSGSTLGTITSSDTSFVTSNNIGSDRGGADDLEGRLYHVSAYNTALSASDVLHNYNALKGRYEDKSVILSGISFSLT